MSLKQVGNELLKEVDTNAWTHYCFCTDDGTPIDPEIILESPPQ